MKCNSLRMIVLKYSLSFGENERLERKIEREYNLREYAMTDKNVSDVAAKHIIPRHLTFSQRMREAFVRVCVGTDCFASREQNFPHNSVAS